MIPPIELWNDHERILYRRRIDTSVPHSGTAGSPATLGGHPGWCVVRGADTRVVAIIMCRGTKLRLFGVDAPDALVTALPGRCVRELLDHPLFATGTVGGDAIIRAAYMSVDIGGPALTIATRTPLIDLRSPPVPIVHYRKGMPLLTAPPRERRSSHSPDPEDCPSWGRKGPAGPTCHLCE